MTFETISNILPTGYVIQDRLEKGLGVEGLYGLSSTLLMHVLQLCLRGGSDDLDGGLSALLRSSVCVLFLLYFLLHFVLHFRPLLLKLSCLIGSLGQGKERREY